MKKLKNSGFTLIELLAVITIMGILMMVAIPAVSRTIANSRRDTFADIMLQYINSARDMYVGDNIKCLQTSGTGDNAKTRWVPASAAPTGVYYIPICTITGDDNCADIKEGSVEFDANAIVQSTTDLLEKGGKSSFGSADLRGYIKIVKTSETREEDGKVTDRITKTYYYIHMIDSGYHGIAGVISEDDIDRSAVQTDIDPTKERTNQAPTEETEVDGETKTVVPHVCKVA